MRKGDFSALAPITDPTTGQPFQGNQILSTRFSPQSLYFLPYIQPPNTPGGTYVYSPPAPSNTNQFDVKIDHQISAKDSFTSSYSWFHLNSYTPGPFPQVGGYNSAALSQRVLPVSLRERWSAQDNQDEITQEALQSERSAYRKVQARGIRRPDCTLSS